MTLYEQLARRYCALLGEDPDERIEGVPAWRFAMGDLEAAMNALDTFGLDIRPAIERLAEAAAEQAPPRPQGPPLIRRVA